MKIAQLWTPVKYKRILPNIATQLPYISGKKNMSRNVSELGQQGDVRYMKEGLDPSSGLFNSDVTIFIGQYPGTWGRESVAHITNKFTRPGGTTIIRPLTEFIIVAAGGGGGCCDQGHSRGGSSGVRGRGWGQGCGRGDTNESPSQLISQLK